MIEPSTPLPTALKAAFVSMDSTLRSNLSVGMPLDLAVMEAGSLRVDIRRRMEQDDPEFAKVSGAWGESLRDAFARLPEIVF